MNEYEEHLKHFYKQQRLLFTKLLQLVITTFVYFSFFVVHANCLDEPKLDVPEYRLFWQSRKTALDKIFLLSFFPFCRF